ncbi:MULTISPECIES: hypothetical protein [Pseudofrankia]|uniref:hypothetical protein n=1 Tax=Pseudofrankia TaxID=2994363 RepID=UPI000234D8EB|nr:MULTISPECIES: hypothetical protein [Pseudofrankia]OHV35023.1 hypothetical protein BCD49_22250 [Pseudofrankia sp. EUN1h]
MAQSTTADGKTTTSSHKLAGEHLLGIYLNDHLAGSTAGLRLARRLAGTPHQQLPIGAELWSIAEEIDEDRSVLIALMEQFGAPRRRYKITAGLLAELVGRLKLNGRLLTRSPLSTMIELETLQLGVEGKRLVWATLRALAEEDPGLGLDPPRFDQLEQRAIGQAARLDAMRLRTGRAALMER